MMHLTTEQGTFRIVSITFSMFSAHVMYLFDASLYPMTLSHEEFYKQVHFDTDMEDNIAP